MPIPAKTLLVEPRIRLRFGRKIAFGPGKADLLEHIDRTGSISQAAKAMEMSYMTAWKIVQSLESGFIEPLVLRTRGGTNRGGALLSPTGKTILAQYREMEAASNAATKDASKRFHRLLK